MNDRVVGRKPLEIGEMPTVHELETLDGRVFEIDGYALDGSIKTFSSSPLTAQINVAREQGRQTAASLIAQIKVQYGIDAAIGPGYTRLPDGKIVPTSKHASLYVDNAQVDEFSRKYKRTGINPLVYYSEEQKAAFQEILPKALGMIPKPQKV